MSATVTPTAAAAPARAARRTAGAQRFGDVLEAERIKFWSVRSTPWSLLALVVVGAGFTTLTCWANAEWLAGPDAGDPPTAYITFGIQLAQIAAIVLGGLTITAEHSTGLARVTYTAVPRRGRVLAAKAAVLAGVLFVAGTFTALLGYLGGKHLLALHGIAVAWDAPDLQRALFGSGLYLAVLGLFTFAVGLIVRHTAAALTLVLGVIVLVGNLAYALPGGWGEWVAKLMPGNAGGTIATPVSFDPAALGPWTGFGVFCAQTAALLGVGWWLALRRDA